MTKTAIIASVQRLDRDATRRILKSKPSLLKLLIERGAKPASAPGGGPRFPVLTAFAATPRCAP